MSWSYSKLSKYERCPAQKQFQYDLKVEVIRSQSPAAARGNQMHETLETYLGKTEMPDWMKPHMPYLEQYQSGSKEHVVKLMEGWVPVPTDDERWLICIIDLHHVFEKKWVTIIDYKSGKRYPDHVKQLELYCIAALSEDPELERAEGKCYYLDEEPGAWGPPVFVIRDQLEGLKAQWMDRVTMMDVDTECAPRPGWYCKWCDYRKSNAGPCRFG